MSGLPGQTCPKLNRNTITNSLPRGARGAPGGMDLPQHQHQVRTRRSAYLERLEGWMRGHQLLFHDYRNNHLTKQRFVFKSWELSMAGQSFFVVSRYHVFVQTIVLLLISVCLINHGEHYLCFTFTNGIIH